MDLSGKVALVTGAAQGIGAGIAKVLADFGAEVAITDVNSTGAKETASTLAEAGVRTSHHLLDVTDRRQVEEVIDEVVVAHGRLDILVNNAGIGENRPFLEQDETTWRRIYDINVFGVMNCCQTAIPYMRSEGGSIVNISSTAGIRSNQWSTHYGSSKHAVIGITQSLAKEFARDDIRVNAIAPSLVLTPHWDERSADIGRIEGKEPRAVIEERIARVPLGRPQTPRDVGYLTAFLVSEYAVNITGQTIRVTGGTDL